MAKVEVESVPREEMDVAVRWSGNVNRTILARATAGETIKIPCQSGKSARRKQIGLNQARKRGEFFNVAIARRKNVVWVGRALDGKPGKRKEAP